MITLYILIIAPDPAHPRLYVGASSDWQRQVKAHRYRARGHRRHRLQVDDVLADCTDEAVLAREVGLAASRKEAARLKRDLIRALKQDHGEGSILNRPSIERAPPRQALPLIPGAIEDDFGRVFADVDAAARSLGTHPVVIRRAVTAGTSINGARLYRHDPNRKTYA